MGTGFLFRGMERFWKWMMVMVAHMCEYTKKPASRTPIKVEFYGL